MLEDLITLREPPTNRVCFCEGGVEQHLSEGAVMVAFAPHLLRTVPGLKHVAVHPDGEHGIQFDFQGWLKKRGFSLKDPMGKTSYGGTYSSAGGQTILINPTSGHGDVVAPIGEITFVAECKGGIINTKHPGQQSRLRRGLCEAIGLSLASPRSKGRRQFAVVPLTKVTESLAQRMASRAADAGIEIALVDRHGNVANVAPK